MDYSICDFMTRIYLECIITFYNRQIIVKKYYYDRHDYIPDIIIYDCNDTQYRLKYFNGIVLCQYNFSNDCYPCYLISPRDTTLLKMFTTLSFDKFLDKINNAY